MEKKEVALRANEALKELYPGAVCSLEADDPFRLLVAVRLSAQCTDARVNLVTPALFAKYPDAQAMAEAAVELLIHPEKGAEGVHVSLPVRYVPGGTTKDS